MTDEELIARLRRNGQRIDYGINELCADAADRIEALTEQLAAARQDTEEAEAYAEELESNLARAECLLTDAAVQLEEGKIKTRRNRAGLIWQFLAEIKGESHDPL